jgi:hypothetical protein
MRISVSRLIGALIFWLHKSNKSGWKVKEWRTVMKKVLRRQTSGYVLSILLLLFGIAALFFALWETWPQVSQAGNPFSVFWESLWAEKLVFLPGVEIKLVYLVVLSSAMIIAAFVVLALSRQWLPLGSNNSWVECPFCKKRWRTSPDKALGFCPHCRQLIHPKLVDE